LLAIHASFNAAHDSCVQVALVNESMGATGFMYSVYYTGMKFFGRSAIKSLKNGLPNMNVLIALGATAAFVYSLIGSLLQLGEG
jgi:cation transport ATPase